MRLKIACLFIVIGFFTSCINQEILIKADGTVHVDSELYALDSTFEDSVDESYSDYYDPEDTVGRSNTITEVYDHELISNFTYSDTVSEGVNISFDLSEADSLSKFLDPIFKLPAKTILTDSTFYISGSNGLSKIEDDVCGCTNMLTYNLTLMFEREIERIETKNTYVSQIGKHTIKIETSVGDMNYAGIKNELTVYFK